MEEQIYVRVRSITSVAEYSNWRNVKVHTLLLLSSVTGIMSGSQNMRERTATG